MIAIRFIMLCGLDFLATLIKNWLVANVLIVL